MSSNTLTDFDITGLGTIYNIFDNKVYGGTGQKCYAYTSTGTYQLTGTTATSVGAEIKSAYGDQLSGKDYCANGREANHDEPGAFNGIPANSEITGMAVYKGKLLVATNNVGYYKEVDGKWRPCPFDEEKNSGQFATQGTYPGGLWVVGNTIYLKRFKTRRSLGILRRRFCLEHGIILKTKSYKKLVFNDRLFFAKIHLWIYSISRHLLHTSRWQHACARKTLTNILDKTI